MNSLFLFTQVILFLFPFLTLSNLNILVNCCIHLAQGLPVMLFSTDESSNKAVIYAGVPPNTPSGFKVLDWLTPSIAPVKGRGGGGKNGVAQGQVSMHTVLQFSLCARVHQTKNGYLE